MDKCQRVCLLKKEKKWNHHAKIISPRCEVGRRSAVIITLSKIDDSISQYMSGIESSEIWAMKIEGKRESWDSETPAGKHANHKLIPFHQDEIFPQNK